MIRLSVLQYQWLILAFFSGAALVLGTALTYLMIWKPRKDNEQAVAESGYEGVSTLRWYLSFMPWILTLTMISVALFGIGYAWMTLMTPPNW